MSKRKTERLLGLVVCLLSTSRYLTAEQVREAVPGYPEQDDLFKRMFERDKEDLRELGVPLETGVNHPFDDDPGYRIRRQAYELPELRLEADEAAVLGLAARVWRRAELAGAAAGALLKLRAAGIDAAGLEAARLVPQGIEPRLGTPEPAFGPLWEAVRDRRPVTFSHRAAGRSEPQRRELEPWGVVNRHGRWYVAGWDRGRGPPGYSGSAGSPGPVKFCGPAGSVTVPDGDGRARAGPRLGLRARPRAHRGAAGAVGDRCRPAAARRRPCSADETEPRAGTWSRRASPTWAGSPTTPPGSARTWWCSTRPTCARP